MPCGANTAYTCYKGAGVPEEACDRRQQPHIIAGMKHIIILVHTDTCPIAGHCAQTD